MPDTGNTGARQGDNALATTTFLYFITDLAEILVEEAGYAELRIN